MSNTYSSLKFNGRKMLNLQCISMNYRNFSDFYNINISRSYPAPFRMLMNLLGWFIGSCYQGRRQEVGGGVGEQRTGTQPAHRQGHKEVVLQDPKKHRAVWRDPG